MTCIGAAVVANDEIMLFREQIDDFAFGLVAPLQADDTGAGHSTYLARRAGWRARRLDEALRIGSLSLKESSGAFKTRQGQSFAPLARRTRLFHHRNDGAFAFADEQDLGHGGQ